MNQNKSTSLLVLGYNRPELIHNLLTNLLRFPGHNVFISIDGSRLGKMNDEKLVAQSRKYVNLFKKKYSGNVEVKFNSQNLGCKFGVSSAIDWFFNSIDSGVILEDDLIISESFLHYSTKMLEIYRDNSQVFSFSGNYFSNKRRDSNNLIFSRLPHVWGWGTWKNRWKLYDVNLMDWTVKEWPSWFNQYSSLSLSQKKILSKLFNQITTGKIDTWDYQLTYTSLKFNLLNIHPATNLVKNVGFNKHATHTRFNVIDPRIRFTPLNLNELKFTEPIHTTSYDNEYFRKSNFNFKLLNYFRNLL